MNAARSSPPQGLFPVFRRLEKTAGRAHLHCFRKSIGLDKAGHSWETISKLPLDKGAEK